MASATMVNLDVLTPNTGMLDVIFHIEYPFREGSDGFVVNRATMFIETNARLVMANIKRTFCIDGKGLFNEAKAPN